MALAQGDPETGRPGDHGLQQRSRRPAAAQQFEARSCALRQEEAETQREGRLSPDSLGGTGRQMAEWPLLSCLCSCSLRGAQVSPCLAGLYGCRQGHQPRGRTTPLSPRGTTRIPHLFRKMSSFDFSKGFSEAIWQGHRCPLRPALHHHGAAFLAPQSPCSSPPSLLELFRCSAFPASLRYHEAAFHELQK